MIAPTTSPALLTTPGTAEQVRKEPGKPPIPPPPPTHSFSQRFEFNSCSGKNLQKFVSFPRLNLPGELTEDGRESATYDVDKGENHFVSS